MTAENITVLIRYAFVQDTRETAKFPSLLVFLHLVRRSISYSAAESTLSQFELEGSRVWALRI